MGQIDLNRLETNIAARTGTSPTRWDGIGNDATYEILAENLPVIIEGLVESFNCSHLSTITAQQRERQEGRIDVLYHFWQGTGFSFLIRLPVDAPKLPSIISILPGADFYEREVAEMFGITFTGRVETPHLLLPDKWEDGPPFIRSEVQDE